MVIESRTMASVVAFGAIKEQENSITEAFPGYVKAAKEANQTLQEAVHKYQRPKEGFVVKVETLKEEKEAFVQQLEKMKAHEAPIKALLDLVSTTLANSDGVSLYSDKTAKNLAKIDEELATALKGIFETVIANNKQLREWKVALEALKGQMAAEITTYEKWLPTFKGLVAQDGKPLSNLEYYGWKQLPTPASPQETDK